MPCSSSGAAGARGATERPLIFELVGTPGAGKTTLAGEVVDLLSRQGVAAATVVGAAREHAHRTPLGGCISRRVPRRLHRAALWQAFYVLATAHVVPFVREHLALVRGVVVEQLRRQPAPAAGAAHVLFWFFQLGARRRFLSGTGRRGEVIVFDDGFLHRAVHVHASPSGPPPDPVAVARYADLVPLPDLVIAVVAERGVCERRVHERGVWRHSRDVGSLDLSRYLERSERVTHLMLERARQRGCRVVEVDNSGRRLDAVRADLECAVAGVLGIAARRPIAVSGGRP
jgi:hypothetical protein